MDIFVYFMGVIVVLALVLVTFFSIKDYFANKKVKNDDFIERLNRRLKDD